MDQFGSDIINEEVSTTVDKLRQQRLKRGECPTCQRKTHKVSRFRNKRDPLTVEGEVVNGICLRCNIPDIRIPSSVKAPSKAAPVRVPDTFVCDDDITVASEITMDTLFIEQQVPKRSNRYNSKPFESVSEETPMTNFRKHDDQVPTDIVGYQRDRRDRDRGQHSMPRVADDEEEEEEDKKWMATQRRQRFHPMSREMYKFNSERSLGIESIGKESTDGSENSSEYFGPPKLHPLSRELYRFTSERSLDVSSIPKQHSDRSLSLDEATQNEGLNANSGKVDNRRSSLMTREPSTTSMSGVSSDSSDGQRIKTLLRGSTGASTKKGGKLQMQADEDDASEKKNNRCIPSDSFAPASVKPAESKGKRPNRFSLRQVDPNRFSLNAKDLRRASDPTDPTGLEMEMRNSRNWNSVDILRDAAAEANGERFNIDDFRKEMEAEMRAKNSQSSQQEPEVHTSPKVSTKKTTTSTDEVPLTMSSFSSPPSAADETKKADRSAASGLREKIELAGDVLNALQIICDALHMHSSSKEVAQVCCTALANLSASSETREIITAHGAINDLFSCIKAEFDCAEVDREAFRALCNLSDSSSETKQIISCDLDTIIATFYLHEKDKYIQSATCSILQQLSVDVICRTMIMAFPEIFDVLGSVIQANPSKKTIEMHACSLLRNLALEENGDSTLRSASFVPFVMMAMAAHANNEELIENACFFLSTVGFKQPEGFGELCTEDGIKCIIKTLQNIDTSASLLEACCFALYAAIRGSDEHKKLCLSTGAIDAIICLILVHPHETSLLETALTVLMSLSSQKKCVTAIVNSGGIGSVVATMRSNPTCSGIIKRGSRFISNVVERDPTFANEAVPAVVSILSCIRDQVHDQILVEELCKSLHYLVLVSENWADRIISADGVSVIEIAMKRNESNARIVHECDVLLQILSNIT